MRRNEEQQKNLNRRLQMQREGKGKTLKEAMAEAGGGLLLQEVLMAEEKKAREASCRRPDGSTAEDPSTGQPHDRED